MTLEEYLQLVDWTGRQLRRDKPGRIPPSSTPVLKRLELSSQTWLDLVKHFRRRFRFEAGRASSREAFRQQRKASRGLTDHRLKTPQRHAQVKRNSWKRQSKDDSEKRQRDTGLSG